MKPTIVITKQEISVNPSKKVIKSNEYQQYVQSISIIEETKKLSKKIIEDGREAFENEKKKGYEAGIQKSKMEQADHMLNVVSRTINYLSDIEKSMAEILMSAVKKIIGHCNQDKLALRLVHQALDHIRNEKKISIRVPVSQFKLIKKNLEEILSNYKRVQFIDVIADKGLSTGDCIMESEIGIIDVSIDVQMAALQKRFNHLKHSTFANISDQNN